MATLNTYLQQVQRLVRDQKQEIMNPDDLTAYINQARREVAMRAECVRVLPPISGAIIDWNITQPGSGYTAPTLVVSSPDSPSGALPFPNGDQATGTVTQIGGQIISVGDTYGGAGYFQPIGTIHDPAGTGAVITPVISPIMTLNPAQEVYPFSTIPISTFPGVASVYTVRSISVLYNQYRYSLAIYSFTEYQARIRQYAANSYQFVPAFGSQFGRGASGSFYFYPPPSQTWQLELDCSCLPQDLIDDESVEVIPDPWTDAVPYFSAHLAYLELQNMNAARMYSDLFDQRVSRYGVYVDRGRVINPYGRP